MNEQCGQRLSLILSNFIICEVVETKKAVLIIKQNLEREPILHILNFVLDKLETTPSKMIDYVRNFIVPCLRLAVLNSEYSRLLA